MFLRHANFLDLSTQIYGYDNVNVSISCQPLCCNDLCHCFGQRNLWDDGMKIEYVAYSTLHDIHLSNI